MHTQHRYTSTNKETKDNLCNSTKSLYQWKKATLSANTSGRCRTHPLPAAKCKCYKKNKVSLKSGACQSVHTHTKKEKAMPVPMQYISYSHKLQLKWLQLQKFINRRSTATNNLAERLHTHHTEEREMVHIYNWAQKWSLTKWSFPSIWKRKPFLRQSSWNALCCLH